MRREAQPCYFVSTMSDLVLVANTRRHVVILATYATPDAAFFAAEALSKESVTHCVWSIEGGERRVRAYAYKGHATWASECPKCNGKRAIGTSDCYHCHGLGATV